MTNLESAKLVFDNSKVKMDKAIAEHIEARNHLQEQIDQTVLALINKVKGERLFVKHLFTNEEITEVRIKGLSDPELDFDDELYPHGNIDVYCVNEDGTTETSDYLTVTGNKILTECNGHYYPIITQPIVNV